MNVLELVLKPRIAEDTFRPIWLRKLYAKVIVSPISMIYIVYAATKYDGHILYDQTIRGIFRELWEAGGTYRESAYKILNLNEKLVVAVEEMKHKHNNSSL